MSNFSGSHHLCSGAFSIFYSLTFPPPYLSSDFLLDTQDYHQLFSHKNITFFHRKSLSIGGVVE